MSAQRSQLSLARWHAMSLMEQMGNVGSEMSRALRARSRNDIAREQAALERFLELMDRTIADARLHGRRKEICRVREVACDFFFGDNEYGSTPESLNRYFMPFAVAARRRAK
jgi:hypothetical protein